MSALVRIVNQEQFAAHFAARGVQSEIARRAGLSRARLNQLVRGTYPVVSIRTAERIETALGVGIGTLFAPIDAELLGRYLAASS